MTDESVLQLHRNTLQVWSSQYSPKQVKKMPKVTVKITVWGALSCKGFYIKVVDGNGTISSSTYCDIIREFIPYGNALLEDTWILEQDSATPHTAKDTKFFIENNLHVLQWPANSPDLTLIGNA